jgi:carbamoyltransferase
MNILGISGLENAMPFKREHWPGLEEREYRITQGQDSAAALVIDGVPIAAAAEERFSREKHSGKFPVNAIHYCLRQAGLELDDIDVLAHAFDYGPYQKAFEFDQLSARWYREVLAPEVLANLAARDLPNLPAARIQSVNHHLAHAASAYYTSGWDDCLVMVVDAMGEVHSVSAYRGRSGSLEKLAELPAAHSIGILYSLITLHLGFDFNADEYKIMGLAPYGDPARYRKFFDETVQLLDDGTVRIPMLRYNRTRDERETYAASRRHLNRFLLPARAPEAEITDDHRDAAAALQECLDKVMLHLCGHFGRMTGCRRLALAGGVALNCTANGRLLKAGLFDNIYIQPAAGDDGSALGAALWWAAKAGEIHNARMPTPFLGPEHPPAAIEEALYAFGGEIEFHQHRTLAETCEEAARLIADGRVIAWYRGRMEFGPRALGHRSILADPSGPEMRDRINSMVKMREAFRPFAPAVSLEEVDRWFDAEPGAEFPYMITTVDVREEYRADLPAITHVNGSARVQTVSREDNAEFHELLKAVGKITGREMVLNTSFNVKGQPIVNTPREAIETFLRTGIEYLFLDDIVIARRARELVRSAVQSFDEQPALI